VTPIAFLCVGAVDFFGGAANFSGVGPSADGQVKPDVCALGVFTTVIGSSGQVGNSSGTSFAAPLMAGFAACLRGAHPQRSNMEVIQAIRESASQFQSPDTLLGYGIPDACKADSILTAWDSLGVGSLPPVQPAAAVQVFPNPVGDVLVLENRRPENPILKVEIVNIEGKALLEFEKDDLGTDAHSELQIKRLPAGSYLLRITLRDGNSQTTKFIRN
jgi:serine protease AprX